jgi:predicted acetyltransferase
MPSNSSLQLRRPAMDALPSYVDALKRDWSPDNIRGKAAADEQLALIEQDAPAFVEALHDRAARRPPITLPDGTMRPRLPSITQWMWDGAFCGSITLRWQRETSELPDHVLGHIGYAVVPWKRGRGYATCALALLLPEAWREGLAYVQLNTDPDNIASQRVILANGGQFVERIREPEAYGGKEALRWRITAP